MLGSTIKKFISLLLICLVVPFLLASYQSFYGFLGLNIFKSIRIGGQNATTQVPNSTQYSEISSNFTSSYFYNLTNAFHYNNDDSCVIVALEQLLSFYNAYWDDDFVDESCETTTNLPNNTSYMGVQSPGVTEVSSPNLFSQLHAISVARGYYNNSNYHFSNAQQINNVLTDYLTTRIDLNKWFISYDYTTTPTYSYPGSNLTYAEEFKNHIISLVNAYVPVIAIIKSTINNTTVYHACIAYYYDTTSQELYYNTGYYYNSFDYLSDSNDLIVGYLALMIKNAPHMHSNNYIINGTAMCSCSLSNHLHHYSYSLYSALKHKKTCHCGNMQYEDHFFITNGLKIYCRDCGYIKSGIGEIIHPGQLILPE